jgi:hypothetical protein
MILVSWNWRGLGSGPKSLAIKYLVKCKKPSIRLIQETKMSYEEVIKQCDSFWRNNNRLTMDARGASGSLCTVWDEKEVSLEHQ